MNIGRWKSYLVGYIQIGKNVWKAFVEDRLTLAAAAVAFYLTLSLLPLLLLMVSVAAFFISQEQLDAASKALTTSLGSGIGEAIRQQILSVVQNRGVLTGVSLAFGLWVGSQVFVITQTALNQIWDVDDRRPFWVRRGLALLMVVVTGILVLLAVLFRYLTNLLGQLDIPFMGYEVRRIPWFLSFLPNFLVPWLLVSLAFLVTYKYLSAKKLGWNLVLPGAVAAGLLWTITLVVFSWYTASFADYSVLYGSLGGFILLMVWFNYSAIILLSGAEVPIAVKRYEECCN